MRGEVQRAVDEAPSLRAAARRVGMNASSLSRAIRKGQLRGPGRPVAKRAATLPTPGPDSWLARVEAAYELSSTEQELAQLGQAALDIAHDQDAPPAVRLAAAGRFAALVKDLGLPKEEHYGDVTTTTRAYPRSV